MAHNVTSPSRNRSHIDSSSRDVLQPSAAVSPREEWEDWMKWDDPLNTIEATASKDPNATKKRKSLSDEGQDFQESVQKQRPPPATRSHNAVERRYRTNINQKITALRGRCFPRSSRHFGVFATVRSRPHGSTLACCPRPTILVTVRSNADPGIYHR